MNIDWADFAAPALATFLTVAILRWLAKRQSEAKPARGNIETGEVSPPTWIAYIGLVFFGAFALGSAYGIVWHVLNDQPPAAWLWLGLFALFFVFFLVNFVILVPGWEVRWDRNGIAGPSKVYTLRPLRSQKQMPGTTVRAFGSGNKGQILFVQDEANERIQWSGLAAGAAMIFEAVRLYAPLAEERHDK